MAQNLQEEQRSCSAEVTATFSMEMGVVAKGCPGPLGPRSFQGRDVQQKYSISHSGTTDVVLTFLAAALKNNKKQQQNK